MGSSKTPREFASSPCMLHEFENMKSDDRVTIYHNPACSKSRETLALIREQGIEPQVIEYLKTPPDEKTLAALLTCLKMTPGELVRREEAEFKEHYAGKKLDPAGWIHVLATHPKLIQRPIVVRGKQAVIGRPPTNVLPLLKSVKSA